MGVLDRTARSILLSDMRAGFWLTLKFMFKPKATLN